MQGESPQELLVASRILNAVDCYLFFHPKGNIYYGLALKILKVNNEISYKTRHICSIECLHTARSRVFNAG